MITTLCTIVVLGAGVPEALPADEPGAVLAAARTLYGAEKYDSVNLTIRAFLQRHGKHAATRELVPLLVESQARSGEYATAERLCTLYEKKFPGSPFLPRMQYTRGILHARQGRYSKALLSFSAALHGGVVPALDSALFTSVDKLCDRVLSVDTISYWMRRETVHPRLREFLAYQKLVKLYSEGQYLGAAADARNFLKEYPRSSHAPRIREMIAKYRKRPKDIMTVAVLAPLSGFHAEVGRHIVDGIQLAFREMAARDSLPVRPVVYDTRGDMVETAHVTHRAVHDDRARVIIGPVLSETAIVSAAMIMDREVVMVSPTATDDGIARLGPTIFQTNVTIRMLGKTIAEYALRNLNIREFALLSPLSDYGAILIRNFKETVEQNGGSIVAEEFFEEGANDYRQQFESLRRKLFNYKKEQEAIEQELAYADMSRDSTSDSLFLADSVIAVGGLFIPAEPDDIVMLAPQVYFHRIRTQLLGSTGWHTNKTLLDGKKYVENAIFSTNFHLNRQDSTWRRFEYAYRMRFHGDPDRAAALGYDAARLTLNALALCGGRCSAEDIGRSLLHTRGYRGASGIISLDDSSGENTEAAIVKIRNRSFVRIH